MSSISSTITDSLPVNIRDLYIANANMIQQLSQTNMTLLNDISNLQRNMLSLTDVDAIKNLQNSVAYKQSQMSSNNSTIQSIYEKQNILLNSKESFEVSKEDKKTKSLHLRAPRPNIGSCESTGKWDNNNMTGECVSCVSTPGWYGEKMFYCNGKCQSEYDTRHVCSTASLVAKTVGQCDAPCKQSGPPALNGGCSDNFDCASGQACVMRNGRGTCIVKESYTKPDIMDYSTVSYLKGFYGKDKKFMGVL